jgi:hypothetical protein
MYTGNNIVTNGLTLLVDASNPRSYVGEPTTNLANNEATRSLFLVSDTTGSLASGSELGPDWKKVTITSVGTSVLLAQFPYITQTSGSTKTYSLEYNLNSTTSSRYFLQVGGTAGEPVTNVTGSGKFIYTFNSSTTGVYSIFLRYNTTNVTGLNDVIYYRYYQVEDKARATPFTPISRPSTWLGLGSTGYNMDTVNGSPLYSNYSSSLQYIDFTNVGTGSIGTSISYTTPATFIPTSSSLTLEVWMRRDGTTYPLLDREALFASSGGGAGFRINIMTSGIIQYLVGDAGASYTVGNIGSGYNLGDNKWHQVVVSFDILSSPGNVITKGYLDGVSIGTSTNVKTIGSIGTAEPAGISYKCCARYQGYVGKVAAYGRVLTADEVLQNYNATKTRYGL